MLMEIQYGTLKTKILLAREFKQYVFWIISL